MKRKYIVFLLIGIIAIICVPFIIDSNVSTVVLTTIQALFSFVTIMLAITLFDKYQAGANLNNKVISLILDYIEFLKGLQLILECYKSNKFCGFEIIKFSKSMSKKEKVDLKISKIYVISGKYINFYSKLTKYIDSPWMPKKIRESSRFLFENEGHFECTTLEKIKGSFYILDFINFENMDINSEEPYKLISLKGMESKEILEKNIEKLLDSIEKWVHEQAADIDIKL